MRLVAMNPQALLHFFGIAGDPWPAPESAELWIEDRAFFNGSSNHVYRYLRDGQHCLICHWPPVAFLKQHVMVDLYVNRVRSPGYLKELAQRLAAENAPGPVGHCTLDCPFMARWQTLQDQLDAVVADVHKADSGQIGKLQDRIRQGWKSTNSAPVNPMLDFWGRGFNPLSLFGAASFGTGDDNDGRYPWVLTKDLMLGRGANALSRDKRAELASIFGIMALVTFLRTGSLEITRLWVAQAQLGRASELQK